jgi:hypothetical protein
MKENYTRIAVILDRSGSMATVQDATIAGFNEFIAEQRKLPGEVSVKLVKFDTEYEPVFDQPLFAVPLLTREMFEPRGMTALYDAQGWTIDLLGRELDALAEAERPSKVIVMTLTDGMENASKNYRQARVAEMIQHQREKYGWEFIYLGANQDAIAVAASMNIPAQAAMTYNANPIATRTTLYAASNYVSSMRTVGQAMFTDDDRLAARAEDLVGDSAFARK